MAKFDPILKGARVLDPANGLDAPRDVGIAGAHIEAVGRELEVGHPRRVRLPCPRLDRGPQWRPSPGVPSNGRSRGHHRH